MPVARITHRQHPNDIAMNGWFAQRIEELAQACEPVSSWRVLLPGLTDDRRADGHARERARARHLPDGERTRRSRCWIRSAAPTTCPNLWVVDGSCFPTAGGYNPTLTLLANAYRVADRFVGQARRQNL